MRSSYKRIGDYIRKVDKRNKDLLVTDLRGLSMTKEFRKSTSNVVGTDLSKYKVVQKWQFACDFMSPIRVFKLPVVLHTEDNPVIVSPAYPVFEIIDHNKLLPEYLMMWMRRSEFDRYVFFRCDSAIRGGFGWEELCDVELPVPTSEKQREIVREYHTIVDRIKLNEQLNQKLEETAQAIYKQWFVDFEFPMPKKHAAEIGKPELEGKPYKSSGGEMVWNDELSQEIPEGWAVKPMEEIIPVKDGTHDSPKPTDTGYPLVTSAHLKNYELSLAQTYNIPKVDFDQVNKRSKVDKYDILFSMIGTVGSICYVLYDTIDFAIKNVGLFKTSQNIEHANYILFYLKSRSAKRYVETCMLGSTQSYITLTDLRNFPVHLPPSHVVHEFNCFIDRVIKHVYLKIQENVKATELHDVVLGKMTKAEATA